jgi:DNA-binding transcriptional ArsR family regulator
VRDNPGARLADVVVGLSLARSSVHQHLKRLAQDGKLRSEKVATSRHYYLASAPLTQPDPNPNAGEDGPRTGLERSVVKGLGSLALTAHGVGMNMEPSKPPGPVREVLEGLVRRGVVTKRDNGSSTVYEAAA